MPLQNWRLLFLDMIDGKSVAEDNDAGGFPTCHMQDTVDWRV